MGHARHCCGLLGLTKVARGVKQDARRKKEHTQTELEKRIQVNNSTWVGSVSSIINYSVACELRLHLHLHSGQIETILGGQPLHLLHLGDQVRVLHRSQGHFVSWCCPPPLPERTNGLPTASRLGRQLFTWARRTVWRMHLRSARR